MPKVLTFVAVALVGHAINAAAQCAPGGPPNLPARRGTLLGVVMDSAQIPIDGAEVFINQPARRTRTGVDGRFALDSLAAGRYTVTVRRVGYEMATQDYQVADSGSHARFCLVADAIRLLPMITAAKRLGLGGVIGDSTYEPVPGAEVQVLAEGRVLTDSAGAFFIPLKAGTYAVVVSKTGYGRQMLSVTIPKDSGREVAVWLGSPPRNPNRMFAAYDDMRIRLHWANANGFALLSSEGLAATSVDLHFAAQAAIRDRLPTGCGAYIDGGPYILPLAVIDKADVATMEIYRERGTRSAPSINPAGTSGGSTITTKARQPPTCGPLVTIYIWLK